MMWPAVQLSSVPDNIWELPMRSSNGRHDLAVVGLQLGRTRKSLLGDSTPSKGLWAKLGRAISSMQLIFGGTSLECSASGEEKKKLCMLAFPDSDCALAFCACLQLTLLHTVWTEEVCPHLSESCGV